MKRSGLLLLLPSLLLLTSRVCLCHVHGGGHERDGHHAVEGSAHEHGHEPSHGGEPALELSHHHHPSQGHALSAHAADEAHRDGTAAAEPGVVPPGHGPHDCDCADVPALPEGQGWQAPAALLVAGLDLAPASRIEVPPAPLVASVLPASRASPGARRSTHVRNCVFRL